MKSLKYISNATFKLKMWYFQNDHVYIQSCYAAKDAFSPLTLSLPKKPDSILAGLFPL